MCKIEKLKLYKVLFIIKYNNGFILDPIVLSEKQTVENVLDIQKKYGFSGFPVTENGKIGSKLVGFISQRDYDFVDKKDTLVKEIPENAIIGSQAYCLFYRKKK